MYVILLKNKIASVSVPEKFANVMDLIMSVNKLTGSRRESYEQPVV